MEKDIVDHYQRCKDVILSYCREGTAFRALIGNHNHWWHIDKKKGTAKMFYSNNQDYDILTSNYRTLYWTAQLFSSETANIEKPFNFERYQISEQIGSREDTIYHSFFLDLDKAKGKDIRDPEVIKWLEKAIKFFADKLLATGVESFGLAFSGGGAYCVLHPRLGMIGEEEENRSYKIEIVQKAFDLFIGNVAAEFFSQFPEAINWVKFDKLNYVSKRQVKTLLSVHKEYPYAVIPLDKYHPKINLEEASLPISDEILENAKGWLSYHDDIDKFGELLASEIEKAEKSTKEIQVSGTRTVEIEDSEVGVSEWAPCIRNILDRKDLKSGEGATRALAVLASYMRYVSVPEKKAYNMFNQKADEWNAETSNIFESWYGCSHLNKPICFVPSCEKMQKKGRSGYPHPTLGDLNVCSPTERCNEIRSPIQYHKNKIEDVFYLDERGRRRINYEVLLSNLMTDHLFKTLDDTEEVLVYDNGIYRPGATLIKQYVESVLGDLANLRVVREIIAHVQRRTYTSRSAFNNNKNFLPVMNGLLNLTTYQLENFNPDKLYTFRVHVEYNSSARYDHTEEFFNQVLAENEDIQIMQEIFGYCLYPDHPAHKTFWWLGTGRNGKTTTGNILTALIGSANTSGVPLKQLDGEHRFAVARLFGKLLNLVAEPETRGLMETPILKSAVGGDTISGEKKGMQENLIFCNFAKFVIYANRVPRIEDESVAFWDRVIVIKFPYEFRGDNAKKNHHKTVISKDGLSGLLNWALVGLERLKAQDWEFSTSPSQENARLSMKRQSQPVASFVEEWTEFDSTGYMEKEALFDAYKIYCDVYKLIIPDEGNFTRDLKRCARVKPFRPRIGKRQIPAWQGIKIKEDAEVAISFTDEAENAETKKDLDSSATNKIEKKEVRNLSEFLSECSELGEYTFSLSQKLVGEREEEKGNKDIIPLREAGGKPLTHLTHLTQTQNTAKGENTATCEICGNVKTLTSYSLDTDGENKTIGICHECRKEIMEKEKKVKPKTAREKKPKTVNAGEVEKDGSIDPRAFEEDFQVKQDKKVMEEKARGGLS